MSRTEKGQRDRNEGIKKSENKDLKWTKMNLKLSLDELQLSGGSGGVH